MLKKYKKHILVLFVIISVIDVYSVFVHNKSLEIVCKPLLMPFLAMYYIASVKQLNKWFLAGLLFSFLGDSFLLFQPTFFVLGLASFLIAHIAYIKMTFQFLQKITLTQVLKAIVPFLLLLGVLLSVIIDNLGEMLFPVVVYGITISTFGTMALVNYLSSKTKGNRMLFIGVFIFMISDSMIAINKFCITDRVFLVMIMITYIIAQYLISKSLIVRCIKKI